MARRYYNQLYKEFAIIDLSRYKEGKYGLRWRTEREVLNTKGQKVCGSKHCEIAEELNVYELPFKYVEDGEVKRELIKVCLCSACSAKLNYGKTETPIGGERQKVDASKQKGKRTAADVEGNTHKKGRT
jgi:protein FRA10AC1